MNISMALKFSRPFLDVVVTLVAMSTLSTQAQAQSHSKCAAPLQAKTSAAESTPHANLRDLARRQFAVHSRLGAIDIRVLGLPQAGSLTIDSLESDPSAMIGEVVGRIQATDMLRDTTGGAARALDYDQFRNDCEDRAHVAAAFVLEHYPRKQVGKIFVANNLAIFGGIIRWTYHVAPWIAVHDKEGRIIDGLVLDPAFDKEKGLTFAQWVQKATSATSDESIKDVRVFLTPPGFRDFSNSQPQFGADFCDSAVESVANLINFAKVPKVNWTLTSGSIKGIDSVGGRVHFHNIATAYLANPNHIEILAEAYAKGKRVDIEAKSLTSQQGGDAWQTELKDLVKRLGNWIVRKFGYDHPYINKVRVVEGK